MKIPRERVPPLALKENIPKLKSANRTHRLKNDHSIEAKSPIRVPQTCKPQLTFRKKTEPSWVQTPLSPTQNERSLVHFIWQALGKLSECENVTVKSYMPCLKIIVKEMIVAIDRDVPDKQSRYGLANSQKIKLQNVVCESRCQAQESSRFKQSRELLEHFNCSKRSNKSCAFEKTSSTLPLRDELDETSKQKFELKKIMYMLEGKGKLPPPGQEQASPKATLTEPLASLSSFNQSPSDESGFTVFQIDKYSLKSSGRLEEELRLGGDQGEQGEGEQSDEEEEEGSGQSVEQSGGHKRKVLNDIISMLNHKYNKNIRLD